MPTSTEKDYDDDPKGASGIDIELATPSLESDSLPPDALPALNPSTLPPDTFPEGGFGWAIVASGALVLFATFGQINAFGIYQTYYTTVMFPDSDPSVIALIGALQPALLFGFGIFIPPIFGHFGMKKTYICGSLVYCFSLFMTALCTEIWQLFLAQGFVFGIGCALSYHPWMNLPSQYFKAKRATAISIVVAGSSLGGVVFPIATQQLFDSVGFKKTNLIFACVSFLLLAIPALFMKQRIKWNPPKKIVDLSALAELPYTLIVLGFCCIFLGLFTPLIFITPFALHVGIDPSLSFYLLSILNSASLFGRILPGIIGDKVGRLNVLLVDVAVSGILCLALWANAKSSGAVTAFAVLIGFFSGGMISLMAPVIAQISEHHAIPKRVSLFFTIIGIPSLVGTPIAGALITQDNGNYDKLITFTGIMFLAGLLFFVPARFRLRPKLMAVI